MWALDPIDGTKGFLRGEQFAVCLALIVDGQVQVGVMGCPNLPVDAKNKDGEKGCLFITVKGQGAFQVTTGDFLNWLPLEVLAKPPVRFLTVSSLLSLLFYCDIAQLLIQRRDTHCYERDPVLGRCKLL